MFGESKYCQHVCYPTCLSGPRNKNIVVIYGDVPNRFAVRPEPGRLDYRIPKFNLLPASIQANFVLVHVARLYDSRNMADQRWNSISGIVHVLTQTQWLRIRFACVFFKSDCKFYIRTRRHITSPQTNRFPPH